MTRDEIIRIALDEKIDELGIDPQRVGPSSFLIRFASRIAELEREACAALCDAVADEEIGDAYRASAEDSAKLIRARGDE